MAKTMAAKRTTTKKSAPAETRSAAAQRAAESDGDFSHYLDKAPTDLQTRFIEWLQGDSVGFDPTAAKTKADAFSEGVRLGVALRMRFQASPENQEVLEEQRARREAGEDEEAPKPKRAAKKAAAPAKRTKTRAQEAEEEEPDDQDEDLEPEEDLEEPEADEEAAEEEPEPAPKPKRVRASRTSSAAAGGSPTAKRPARRTRAAKSGSAAPF